ncbi:unnamed protein product [Closterium sp. NIES-53]
MLALCQEHRLEHRTKHIALRYFLARELQQRGQLRLAYVASQANTADVFTKALQPCDHQRFCTVSELPQPAMAKGYVASAKAWLAAQVNDEERLAANLRLLKAVAAFGGAIFLMRNFGDAMAI